DAWSWTGAAMAGAAYASTRRRRTTRGAPIALPGAVGRRPSIHLAQQAGLASAAALEDLGQTVGRRGRAVVPDPEAARVGVDEPRPGRPLAERPVQPRVAGPRRVQVAVVAGRPGRHRAEQHLLAVPAVAQQALERRRGRAARPGRAGRRGWLG